MSLISIQPLIDNLHYIIMSMGFLLWALSSFVSARAKSDPTVNKWDEWAGKLTWASGLYSQAIDWLANSNNLDLGPGQSKLMKLNELVKSFEGKIAAGRYLEAINDVVGFWTAAKSKLAGVGVAIPPVNIPPVSIPPVGSQTVVDIKIPLSGVSPSK